MLKKMFGAAAVLALGAALPANATTVAVSPDQSWHAFDVSDVLSADMGLNWFDFGSATGEALSFTINVAAGQAVQLTVVDAGYAGDRFEVFDNGNSIGLTSFVPADGAGLNVNLDFAAALANTSFSSGFFYLGEGIHTITGSLFQSSLDSPNNTVGALSVASVPLPAPLLLLLGGGGFMGLFTRRRKTAAA
jgi:hypothetical protein